MFTKKNYIEESKKNETIFRLILDHHKVDNKDLTIEEIYTKYSTGDRYGIWTILNFEEKEDDNFEFASENIATLSGRGSVNLWTLEKGKLKFVKNTGAWMS